MTDERRRMLDHQLRQARWRLDITRALAASVWTTTAALIVGALVAGLDQLLTLNIGWPTILLLSLAGGLVTALAFVAWNRSRLLDAAAAIDRAWSLKDRLSTLVSLPEDQQSGEAASALANDVDHRAKAIRVSDRLPITWPRRLWAPLVPLLCFILAVIAIPPLRTDPRLEAKETTAEERARVEQQAKELSRKAEQRREELVKSGANELADLNAEIEKASSELTKNPRVRPEEAAVKLGDLARELEKRQSDGSLDRMKRALANLPNAKEGPASDLQKALREGDFKDAAEQLKKLREQIDKGDLSAEEKKQLGEQLAKMEEQLKKAASMAERAKQLEKGLSPEETQKQLARLEKQAEELKKLDKLAEKLGACSKCMGGDGKSEKGSSSSGEPQEGKSGEEGESSEPSADQKQLADELKDAERLLNELAQDESTQQMLNDMKDDLDEARQRMLAQGEGKGKGSGMGEGRGSGDRPESEDATRARQTSVRSKTTDGKSFVTGKTDGPLVGGQSKAELRQAVTSATQKADEAVTRQSIPPDYKDHTREYFERLHGQLQDPQ